MLFLHVWNSNAISAVDASLIYVAELHETQKLTRPSEYFTIRQNLYRPAVFFDGLGSHMISVPLT
jgi:hypothetical protein